ncbi:glycosyltransferase [Mycetocola sp.]|uniref:glycosyltransferase family 2 protein n=1 Tax=Mycetocola sp. TaxID=1871042 RepID=UPI00260D9691|nr:glycosyltransferase [Mycetocola sp.]MCU1561601.1 glycosyl transferase [Mycetocola sp.]
MPEPTPQVGVVVLTQGTRPDDLERGIRSVLAQTGVVLDVVVVGNGWQPEGLPAGVRGLGLPENVGIPAGRNRGADEVSGEYIFFLDDDAFLPDAGFLESCVALVGADPGVGLVQPRLTDPTGEPAPRRWIPRIRKGDARDSGDVFSCLEAAVFLPRHVFDATGGWASPFFYAHEGIELAWRVWDQGKRAWYAGNLEAHHPVVIQTRHPEYYRLNARNRVWLARRNLPLPLIPLYVGAWTGVQILRWRRQRAALGAWFGGWREGWRTNPGERRPLRWSTVWRMARAGRPPVI